MQKNDTSDVIWLKKTDSTSTWLRSRIEELPERYVVAAIEQTCGRGQGDHSWHSAPGQNLTFSVFLRYRRGEFPAASQELLTMSSSLAAADFLAGYGIRAGIKKPNDIYVGKRKICGMLIENGIKGSDMEWSIVGMGLDVNQCVFPDDIPNPVSMKMVTGANYDIKKCLDTLLRHFFLRFDSIWTDARTLESDYRTLVIA